MLANLLNRQGTLTFFIMSQLIAGLNVTNAADAITKQTGGIMFACHLDTITGHLAPTYVSSVPLDSSL
jgi:hypothetical protein